YTSENVLEGRPQRLLRPRVLVYSGLLAVIATALAVAVLLRVPLQMDVLRDRNTLFRDTPEGLIENVYTLRVMNMDSQPHTYAVTAQGIDGLTLQLDRKTIQAVSGEVVDVPVRLQAVPENVRGRSNEVTFTLTAQDNPKIRVEEPTRFLGPTASGR
ncbi:MAG: FixG Ig-like domain-containing protein, partial [Pseudomonadota bacterium]